MSLPDSAVTAVLCVVVVSSHPRKPWSKFINSDNAHLAKPETLDFIDKLLR